MVTANTSRDTGLRLQTVVSVIAAGVVLAGCAVAPQKPAKEQGTSCKAVSANDPFIGNWLAVRRYQGVPGELHMLISLKADGTMAYTEQLKRGKSLPRQLNETGCWSRNNSTLTLRTTQSNGVPVELDDPIYANQFEIRSQAGKTLTLVGPQGEIKAQRMPDDYRFPI